MTGKVEGGKKEIYVELRDGDRNGAGRDGRDGRKGRGDGGGVGVPGWGCVELIIFRCLS